MDIALLLLLLIFFLVMTVPIGIALGLATAITMYFSSPVPLTMIAQTAFAGIDSFPLLAIPFFMLAGSLMGYGGISKRLVGFAESLVGFMIGGLAMVTITACMFFAAISGSGPATVSAIGSFMIPAMKEKRYGGPFAAALSAAAGSIGVIIPPSIPFVIYGVVSGASVGEMFLSGVMPGLVIGTSLMAYSYFVAKRRGYPCSNKPRDLKNLWLSFKDAVWALLVPVIILGGIYGGIFTPTEAAVVGVVYALFTGAVIYRQLTFKKVYEAMVEAGVLSCLSMFILGGATTFGRLMTMERIPQTLAAAMLSITNSPLVLMMLIMFFLLITGMFIDTTSNVVLFTPLFLPIAKALGYSPVLFGVVMTMNLCLGMITPPVGVNLYVAQGICKAPFEHLIKESIPLIAALMVAIILTIVFPEIALFIPKLLGMIV